MDKKIIKELIEYCNYFHIPLNHIVEIISDLKVIPMIRGKGFEYTIFDALNKILPKEKWEVLIPNINAQYEVHDVDVFIIRKKDNKKIRIECKLAGKGSFRENKGNPLFKVKCMRSRTVSDNLMAEKMAAKYGVSKELVLSHADNYREGDFDFVITSMSNAFWDTEDGMYLFNGTAEQLKIMNKLFPKRFPLKSSKKDFNKNTFNFLLFANSKDINVNSKNNIICSRKKCIKKGTHKNCGFIPNYPIIILGEVVKNKCAWKQLEQIEQDLNNFLDNLK